jgi:methylated-DNA-[protein]-cysteine S-methyltransferase
MNPPAYNAIIAAPGFALGVHCTAEEILAIEYLPAQPEQAADNPLAAEAVRQLRAYLNDPAAAFGLPLRPSGTTFQRRVWAEIETIPPGQVRSYGDVAKRLHNAPRAVGQACGANPFPLVVPCHRVVASGGGLGGFAGHSGGFLVDVKRWLLQHENSLPR